MVGARCTAVRNSFRMIHTGKICYCFTNTSMATTVAAAALATSPDGPRWWPSSYNNQGNYSPLPNRHGQACEPHNRGKPESVPEAVSGHMSDRTSPPGRGLRATVGSSERERHWLLNVAASPTHVLW